MGPGFSVALTVRRRPFWTCGASHVVSGTQPEVRLENLESEKNSFLDFFSKMTFQSFPLSFSFFWARKLKNCQFFFTKAAKTSICRILSTLQGLGGEKGLFFSTSCWNVLHQEADILWSSLACLSVCSRYFEQIYLTRTTKFKTFL
jgi:hypothetical protein